jgi:hypothetical protein
MHLCGGALQTPRSWFNSRPGLQLTLRRFDNHHAETRRGLFELLDVRPALRAGPFARLMHQPSIELKSILIP